MSAPSQTGVPPFPPGRAVVKICGVTRPEDAVAAVELGADLVGLNFHPASPRFLGRDAAREIARAIAGRALVAGVFVALPTEEIAEVAADVGLDLVQLHGDHGPEVARRFGGRAIQVFRRGAPPPAEELALYPDVWAFLFDTPPGGAPAAGGPDAFGGTGETWDHGALGGLAGVPGIAGLAGLAGVGPFLVAGGLRPGNARRALLASGARGVDVCSGVESAPGVKDRELMRRLIEEVRDGEARRGT